MPALLLRIDDRELVRLAPDGFGARAWLLGVIAVQCSDEGGRVRSHLTGAAAPIIHALEPGAQVHITLVADDAAPPPCPALAAPEARASASLSLFLDGLHLRTVTRGRRGEARRAFGHVFCRFHRGGLAQPGFDLTEFLIRPHGQMYERVVSAPLAIGQTVSYRYSEAD